MFKITGGKGFQMTFANGWTVSVQFGPGNYCENRNINMMITAEQEQFAGKKAIAGNKGSIDAEIAAWDKDGNWHNFGDDRRQFGDTAVKGWCSTDEVANFIHMIASK